LTLTGHTDNASRQERASGLSRRRAAAVMAELVHRGVPTDHLTAEGNSPETTAHDTSSEDERADRRKVTLEFSEH
jgi:outer membrane protein OmpA-like peptidoglycan-associated protein